MNNYEIVAAIQILLEARQAELLKFAKDKNTGIKRGNAAYEELYEIEVLVEKAREGYTE